MRAADLIVYPIGELATTESAGIDGPAHGKEMSRVTRIANGALAVTGETVIAAGAADQVLKAVERTDRTVVLDASANLVTAGLVDPHTHLVFSGNRANEFAMRCQGKSYAEIAAAGGGIVASMAATRKATIEELVASGLKRLHGMLACGTTTCEVKTGYGLDCDSELRMLEAILTLRRIQPVEVVPTFMPAHAFPPHCDRSVYVAEIVEQILPRAARIIHEAVKADRPFPVFNDVFCDEGYFSLDQTREILSAGLKLGLTAKVHADEFVNLGATGLAVKLDAASADHLLNVSSVEMKELAASNTVAVLLPGTSFFLNLKEHAPARAMIDAGVAVALGSDFNPGSCHIFSLPFIWGLACLHLHMTPEEALTALTYNAAWAVGLGQRIGALAAGRQADFLVYEVGSLEEVPYNLATNPIKFVYKQGRLVYQRSSG